MSHDCQVTIFWTKVLTVAERERLAQNVANSARGAAEFIQRRVVGCMTYMYIVILGCFWVARLP